MSKLLRFPFTCAAAAVVVAVVILDVLRDDIDLFGSVVSFLSRLEHHGVIMLLLALLLVVATVENIRAARRKRAEAKRQAELQAEQLRVVQVTCAPCTKEASRPVTSWAEFLVRVTAQKGRRAALLEFDPDQALCPKCFAGNISAPMGEAGQGCSNHSRRCLSAAILSN